MRVTSGAHKVSPSSRAIKIVGAAVVVVMMKRTNIAVGGAGGGDGGVDASHDRYQMCEN